MATKPPRQGADAIHHHLDPLAGQSVSISIVEGRDDALLESLVEIIGIASIGDPIFGVTGPLTDCETVGPIVGFGPPSIQDAAVETTIEYGLLTASSGGLQWAPRIVQPNVDPLNQVSTNIDVIVFDEGHFSSESRVMTQVGNLLDEPLARLIFGMRFTCENQLHWPF